MFFVIELCLLIQRNELYVWDISSDKPHFVAKRDLYGLELPKGTVLELELVQEYIGEVLICNFYINAIYFCEYRELVNVNFLQLISLML